MIREPETAQAANLDGDNPLVPYLGKLTEMRDLATEIKMFRVELLNGGSQAFQDYKPGQFAFLSAFGAGEAPFGIANTPQRGKTLDFAVNRLGCVTTELHELSEGDVVGVRGPMGNWFPLEQFTEKNLLVIGGGIGGAPLRPVIQTVLDNRQDYAHLKILWAARHPSLLVFTDEYDEWRETRYVGEALQHVDGIKSIVLFGWGLGEYTGYGTVSFREFGPTQLALLTARASVFALDVSDADWHTLEVGLRDMAEDTGGFYEKTHLLPTLAMQKLRRTLPGRYEIVLFKPDNIKDSPVHDIEVKVKRKGDVRVLARGSWIEH